MVKQIERILSVERVEDLIAVFGSFDENTKRIEEALDVKIVNRGTDLKVSGDEENVHKAIRTLEGLLALSAKGETIDEQRVRYLITLVREGNDDSIAQMAKDVVCITYNIFLYYNLNLILILPIVHELFLHIHVSMPKLVLTNLLFSFHEV